MDTAESLQTTLSNPETSTSGGTVTPASSSSTTPHSAQPAPAASANVVAAAAMAAQFALRTTTPVELFVGDLSFFCAEEDLVALFTPFGAVVDVVVCRSDTRGHSLLYGFVKMRDRNVAQYAANSLNGQAWRGRTLRVQVGASSGAETVMQSLQGVHIHVTFTAPPPVCTHAHQSHSQFRSHTINPHTHSGCVTELKLREIFNRAGDILDVIVKRHAVLKNPSSQVGYGFVYFPTAAEAERAISLLDGQTVDGILLHCALTRQHSGGEKPSSTHPHTHSHPLPHTHKPRERVHSHSSNASSTQSTHSYHQWHIPTQSSDSQSLSLPHLSSSSTTTSSSHSLSPRASHMPFVPTLPLHLTQPAHTMHNHPLTPVSPLTPHTPLTPHALQYAAFSPYTPGSQSPAMPTQSPYPPPAPHIPTQSPHTMYFPHTHMYTHHTMSVPMCAPHNNETQWMSYMPPHNFALQPPFAQQPHNTQPSYNALSHSQVEQHRRQLMALHYSDQSMYSYHAQSVPQDAPHNGFQSQGFR